MFVNKEDYLWRGYVKKDRIKQRIFAFTAIIKQQARKKP
jgi:hypothetical protein